MDANGENHDEGSKSISFWEIWLFSPLQFYIRVSFGQNPVQWLNWQQNPSEFSFRCIFSSKRKSLSEFILKTSHHTCVRIVNMRSSWQFVGMDADGILPGPNLSNHARIQNNEKSNIDWPLFVFSSCIFSVNLRKWNQRKSVRHATKVYWHSWTV